MLSSPTLRPLDQPSAFEQTHGEYKQMGEHANGCKLSVNDVLNNPHLFLDTEITLADFMVAQGCDQLNQDLCWMLSEEWLDASSNPADAVIDHSRAIQICVKSLSVLFIDIVGPCGGWAVDAYSVAQVQGTLTKGTNGFAYDLINVNSVIVDGQEIVSEEQFPKNRAHKDETA